MSLDIRQNLTDEQEFVLEGLPFAISGELVAQYGETYIIRTDACNDVYVVTEDDEE